jgi:Tfp pilus assembly protein PilN
MIKINLLSEGRPKVSKARALPVTAGLTSEPANLWLLIVMVLGLLVIGGRYFLLQSTINQKDEEIATVQKEVDELKSIIAEVEQFEKRRTELEHKITVINNLKAAQRGPVEIMDQISKALPELLWLNRMQAKGTLVSLNGLAFNTNAVANLIDNLDGVEEFAEPVLKDAAWRDGLYSFVVEFTFDPAAVQTNSNAGEPAEQAAG